MTITQRLRFTKDSFKLATQQGLAEATTHAVGVGERLQSVKARFTLVGIVAVIALGTSSGAFAAAAKTCGADGATSKLVQLFQNIGALLYLVGGVFSLVCFAGAALLFMASGTNTGRAEKGMKWAKNTVIGLAFLAGGYFFRSIIVDFVGGSAAAVSGADGATSQGVLTDCDLPGAPTSG